MILIILLRITIITIIMLVIRIITMVDPRGETEAPNWETPVMLYYSSILCCSIV